jgi:hypothetical protein
MVASAFRMPVNGRNSEDFLRPTLLRLTLPPCPKLLYPRRGTKLQIVLTWGSKQDQQGGTAMNTTTTSPVPKLILAAGVTIPDSKLAREVTELIRDTETTLLFNHSSRVYYFAASTGKRNGLTFDSELLYVSAMFHDMGLMPKHSSAHDRFEVDGANTARDFLRQHNIPQEEIDRVWTSIALHTTPGIPQYMHPLIALLTTGVEMDVLGIAYPEFTDTDREAIVQAFPRTEYFKEDIIQAFYNGIKHKPETTFGNVKADVLADKDPKFKRTNFCSIIRGSAWQG